MPVSQSDIDALNAALASGELSIESEGRRVQYRSVADLIRARDDLQRQLDAAAGAASGAGRGRLTRLYQGGRD